LNGCAIKFLCVFISSQKNHILKDNLIGNYYSPLFMKIYYSNVCYKIEKVILQEKFEKIKLLQIFLPIVSEITLQIHSFLIIFFIKDVKNGLLIILMVRICQK
jgi:hypothetical protein